MLLHPGHGHGTGFGACGGGATAASLGGGFAVAGVDVLCDWAGDPPEGPADGAFGKALGLD